MYKVVTQKDALCAMSQQRSLSARSRPKLPQLNSNRTSALQSNFQPHFGYVSIDHLIPYSFVVRLQSIIIIVTFMIISIFSVCLVIAMM